MPEKATGPNGEERRREPRTQAEGPVRVGWYDRRRGSQFCGGELADESASGSGLLLRNKPPKRTSLQISHGASTRWAEIRSVSWQAGQTRVGVEYETAPLAFLD